MKSPLFDPPPFSALHQHNRDHHQGLQPNNMPLLPATISEQKATNLVIPALLVLVSLVLSHVRGCVLQRLQLEPCEGSDKCVLSSSHPPPRRNKDSDNWILPVPTLQ
ncbi:unnamed protein product [Pleuronectes platessa]|uniref:Uncharacterized protein n=1 Tax=Pleuronectes platessa TaxID=8262 RepID=A0A9N7TJR4_PLEPL|nr:unnamed protein product [Pleuronectes platessa]